MRALFLALTISVIGCGSSSDASSADPANEPAPNGTGGDQSITMTNPLSVETGGNAPTATSSTGRDAATGGNNATGGAGAQFLTGGSAGTGGAMATGGSSASVQCPVGSIGCPCDTAGDCSGSLACHPMLHECVTVPKCAGHKGYTCLYGPCDSGLTCVDYICALITDYPEQGTRVVDTHPEPCS